MKEDNNATGLQEIADGFELTQVDPRLEFGMYDWIGDHCAVDPSIPGGGCTW